MTRYRSTIIFVMFAVLAAMLVGISVVRVVFNPNRCPMCPEREVRIVEVQGPTPPTPPAPPAPPPPPPEIVYIEVEVPILVPTPSTPQPRPPPVVPPPPSPPVIRQPVVPPPAPPLVSSVSRVVDSTARTVDLVICDLLQLVVDEKVDEDLLPDLDLVSVADTGSPEGGCNE